MNTEIFGYEAETAAWRNGPVWALIALQDRTIAPELQRRMSERSGAEITEVDVGHLVQISHPDEVTSLIKQAAESVN